MVAAGLVTDVNLRRLDHVKLAYFGDGDRLTATAGVGEVYELLDLSSLLKRVNTRQAHHALTVTLPLVSATV